MMNTQIGMTMKSLGHIQHLMMAYPSETFLGLVTILWAVGLVVMWKKVNSYDAE